MRGRFSSSLRPCSVPHSPCSPPSSRPTQPRASPTTPYQIARPLFFRIVGEYTAADRLPLRDESRTNGRLLFKQPDGSLLASTPERDHTFRADWLFSYQPNPGTVFFAGYGSTYFRMDSDPADLTRRWRSEDLVAGARRTTDAFFVKASYLLRM